MEKAKRKLSREKWQRHVGEQARSGLSQLEYCKREGINKSNFAYWKRRLRGMPGEKRSGFASVEIISQKVRYRVRCFEVEVSSLGELKELLGR